MIKNLHISSVGQLQAETIGLPGLLGLSILGKRYITSVLGVLTIRLEVDMGCSPALTKSLIEVLTFFWWVGVKLQFNLV